MEQLRALLHRRIPLPQAWRRDVVLTSVCPSVIPPLRDVDTRDVNRFIPPPRPQISVTDKSPQHRRNNHGDQGRQVPPTFGFGGGDQQMAAMYWFSSTFGRTQLLITIRRLKTYLRNSMSQQRLSHLAVLHVHVTLELGGMYYMRN